jgi:hypothetical protein
MTTGGNIVIPDTGTIGSASDTNAIGISSGGVVSITATTDTTNGPSTGALTVSGGVGIAKSVAIGEDIDIGGMLIISSDTNGIEFGDEDIYLTYVSSDNGLRLNSTKQLQFNDSKVAIYKGGTDQLVLKSNNVAFTMPNADGSNGENLTTNGSGVLSWASAGGGAVSAVANGANNRIATFSSGDALNGESTLTFDGTDLQIVREDALIKFGAASNAETTLSFAPAVNGTAAGGGLTMTNLNGANQRPAIFKLKTSEGQISGGDPIASLEFATANAWTRTSSFDVCAGIHAFAEATHSNTANATSLVFTVASASEATAFWSDAATQKMKLSSAGNLTLITGNLILKNGGSIRSTASNGLPVIGTEAITIANNGLITRLGAGTYGVGTTGEVLKWSQYNFAYWDTDATSSDSRIKTNIVDISDSIALQYVRDIPCRYYNYIDTAERGTEQTPGFIAQEVEAVFPLAVSTQTNCIPNEYRLLTNYTLTETTTPINTEDTTQGNYWNLTINDLTDLSSINKYKIIVSNETTFDLNSDNNESIKITAIDGEQTSFLLENQWTHIFLYGKEVTDFKRINKTKIFTLYHSAIQQIDTTLTAEQAKIASLETELAAEKAKVVTLESEVAAIKAHLGL